MSLKLKFTQNLNLVFFPQKNMSGVSGAKERLEMVDIWSEKVAQRNGDLEGGTYLYHL